VTSGKVATTVGYERRNNPALRFTEREAFVRHMNADQPARPANIANIVAINQGRRPLTMDVPTAPALTLDAFDARRAAGAVVVDTRSTAAYAAGHVPGVYHVHVTNAEFEQRVGWLAPPDAPILLVVERTADVERALHALAFVGLDARVEGYLKGGLRTWIAAGRPMAMLPQITVHELRDRLEAANGQRTLDVREAAEWHVFHIDGASHLTYKEIADRIDELGFPSDDPIAVVCEGGVRSSTACSLLEIRGYRNLANVAGGMAAWNAAGLPTVDAAGCPIRS
jgi:hydroxyacylglutathione hydrolase